MLLISITLLCPLLVVMICHKKTICGISNIFWPGPFDVRALQNAWSNCSLNASWPTSHMILSRQLTFALALIFAALTGGMIGPVYAQEKPAAAPANTEETLPLPDPNLSDTEFTQRLIHLTRAELAELASRWFKRTRQEVKDVASLNIELSTGKVTDKTQLQADLDTALRHRNLMFRKLNLILEEWQAKGGKADDLAEYRQFAVAILRRDLQLKDPDTIRKFAMEWLTSPHGGVRIGLWLLSLFASLAFAIVIAWILTGLFRRALTRVPRMSRLLRDFLSRTAYWLILAIGIVVVLSLSGINITPFLAAFGGASFIIGFAAQSTLSNLASGLLLMINRPFDVGNKVQVAGVSGTVQQVSTVSTTILTSDKQTVVVPNTQVWGSVIKNLEGSEEQSEA